MLRLRGPASNVLLVALITAAALGLRLWRFRLSGELIDDEAYFANMASGISLDRSILGWESLGRFNYGLGILFTIRIWEKLLSWLGVPFDELTMHLPQVGLGILMIWTAFLIVRKLVAPRTPALAVAALIAVMPMHVSQSRATMHWMLAAWLCLLVVYAILAWCERDVWWRALAAGLALAAYIQSDGLQLLLLSYIPVLLWLCAAERLTEESPRGKNLTLCAFGSVLVLAGILFLPNVYGWLVPAKVDSWSSIFKARLAVYSAVSMTTGVMLAVIFWTGARARLTPKLHFVRSKIINPFFIIPASLSFMSVACVALGSWVESGIPQGILGHGFAKRALDPGLYVWSWVLDLRRVCGWPVVFLVIAGLLLLPLSLKRSRTLAILGGLAFFTNASWLFFVPPSRYNARDHYSLASSAALVCLAVVSLWFISERLPGRHKKYLWCAGIPLICLLTLPFTLSQLERKTVLGIGPYGEYGFGANIPPIGGKDAFKYVRDKSDLSERVLTSYNLNIAKFYLERPWGVRNRVIGSFHSSPPPHEEVAELLKKEGSATNWYVISRSFSRKYLGDFDSELGLEAVVEGCGEPTEIWRRGYRGPIRYIREANEQYSGY